MKRDCPEIPEDQRGPGACFSCGEVGYVSTLSMMARLVAYTL